MDCKMSANTAKKSIRSFFTAIPSTTSNKKPRSDSVTSMLETPAATTSVENLLLKDETECTDDPMITSNSVESLNLSHGSNRPVDIELVGWQPFDTMEHSWRERLIKECKKPYFQNLLAFLQGEVSRGVTIFPPASQIFTAFNLCPFGNVKVVVIGQDPYHGECQAHGLAFSVQKNIQIPPSLRNMITEAMNDPKIRITNPNHGNLECWSKQGVLMLNTVLTVRKAEANSHQKKGWEEFTDAVVKELKKKDGLVYMLWGKPAQSKCSGIDQKRNVVLTCSHPSPLSAYKTSEPFVGSRIFSRCNEALIEMGKEPIDWNIR